MSVKAYPPQQQYEKEYEMWTIVTQEAFLSMGEIYKSYSCVTQYLKVCTKFFSYGMMINVLTMLMIHNLPLSL